MNQERKAELLIVTGMSGAGRSTVGNALEDLGWYVVDNLPPQMLGPISDLFSLAKTPLPKLAVIMDVRGGEFFGDLHDSLQSLRQNSVNMRLLFLEATDAALVKRFENVRRPHPLQADGTILDGITAERNRLLAIRETADVIIDTSDLNIHQLSNKISDSFSLEESKKLQVTVMSFGFKYGLPADADNVADMRFLPNPFWDEALRPFTGEDRQVSNFVLHADGAAADDGGPEVAAGDGSGCGAGPAEVVDGAGGGLAVLPERAAGEPEVGAGAGDVGAVGVVVVKPAVHEP